MATITLEVPQELSSQLGAMRDRLPELLALSLQQPPLAAHIYRFILDFLASNSTPEQIAAFGPTPEMQDRLQVLLTREKAHVLIPAEHVELDEYERIEHLMVLIKAGSLPYLSRAS